MTAWDDPYYASVEKSYHHGPWKGMEARDHWNSLPSHTHWHTCISCGYRWSQDDFTYALNDKDYPSLQPKCWNCYQLDTKPEYMAKVWDFVDGNGRPVKAPAARLDHL